MYALSGAAHALWAAAVNAGTCAVSFYIELTLFALASYPLFALQPAPRDIQYRSPRNSMGNTSLKATPFPLVTEQAETVSRADSDKSFLNDRTSSDTEALEHKSKPDMHGSFDSDRLASSSNPRRSSKEINAVLKDRMGLFLVCKKLCIFLNS